MKITIPGDPIPKARARVTRKGFAYDPQSKQKQQTRKFLENHLREFYENKENHQEGYKIANGESFEVSWYFHMPIPKSFNQFKKNACKWGFIEHISKPDRSNLEKFYEDCANGILWKDDSQIVCGEIIKKYCTDDKPKTEIIMQPIKEPNEDIKNIVSLFSPEDIYSIVKDANNLDPSHSSLTQVAHFLSKIADNHSPKLAKIKKNYPGHWKKLDKNSPFIHT